MRPIRRYDRMYMMFSRGNEAGTEPRKRPTLRDNAFFINSAAFTIFLTACAIHEEMNRVAAERPSSEEAKQMQSEEGVDTEENFDIEELKKDVESALCACNKPANIFCIPSLLSSVAQGETVTIDTLRAIAKSTSSELSVPVCKILDNIERKPELLPVTITLIKRRLSALPKTDWRKHAFTEPLEQCEKCMMDEQVRLAKTNQ